MPVTVTRYDGAMQEVFGLSTVLDKADRASRRSPSTSTAPSDFRLALAPAHP